MPGHSPPAADSKESIIVVSDVHLGGNIGSHHDKFCDFLAWITTFPQKIPAVPCDEKEDARPATLDIAFDPLTKLVLLGDIIDLWDPKKQDRKNVILESVRPLSLLHALPCDKVYVTGNHDADLWEMVKDDASPDKRSFPWKDGYDFSIYPRHYPPSEKTAADNTAAKVNRGVPVNRTHYTFLHGHQFDGEQVTYVISEILKEPFDPIDTLMDLANMSVSKIFRIPADILVFCLWVLSLVLVTWTVPYDAVVKNAFVLVISLAVAVPLLLKFPAAQAVLGERKPKVWERALIGGLFLGPFVALVIYGAAFAAGPGILPAPASFLLPAYAVILTLFALIIVVPRLIGCAQRKVYGLFASRDKTVEDVLDDGFVDERDTIRAEVIVFGHTHRAGYAKKTFAPPGNPAQERSPEKLFVNTGCWADTGDTRPVDTFVYINRTGLYLLEWKGPGKINCLFHAPHKRLHTFAP